MIDIPKNVLYILSEPNKLGFFAKQFTSKIEPIEHFGFEDQCTYESKIVMNVTDKFNKVTFGEN